VTLVLLWQDKATDTLFRANGQNALEIGIVPHRVV